MANQRIDQLGAETTPSAADLLPIYSIAGSDTKKITIKNLVQQGAALVDDASIPLAKVSLGGLSIANANIDASAAISYSKLAPLTSGNIVLGNSSNIAASQAVTGDVTISNTGVTAIATGVIVDADINASAAIVDTKLATISTASKVSNSATTATNLNTASAIVSRDASGNFTAGTITAALTGTASGNLVSGGALGTPSSGTLTSCTGLPISTGVSGLGTGAATFLATPSSANLAALLTDETGSGANVFATSPTLISPALGTPSSGVLTNCTNLPIAISGTAGAMSPGTGLSVTGGGVLNHTSSITAGTTSGFTYNAQGHITGAVALAGADLPISTSSVRGAVRPGTGLSVDGNGILAVTAAILAPGAANATLPVEVPATASEYVLYNRKPPSWSTLTKKLPLVYAHPETNDNVVVLLNSTKSPVINAPKLKSKLNRPSTALTFEGVIVPAIVSPLSLVSSILPALPR